MCRGIAGALVPTHTDSSGVNLSNKGSVYKRRSSFISRLLCLSTLSFSVREYPANNNKTHLKEKKVTEKEMSEKLHPIHPSQENRLNPEFKAFYNEFAIATPKIHTIPIPVIRSLPRRPFPGCGPDVPVGKKEEIAITPDSGPAKGVTIPTRCYTPPGAAPSGGWPVLVFYHGGGWTIGSLESETDVITNICTRAKCVVVSVDYRQVVAQRGPTLSVPCANMMHQTCPRACIPCRGG